MKWTEDELKLALALYCQLPFGKMHSRNKDIISLATKIGRTSSGYSGDTIPFNSIELPIIGIMSPDYQKCLKHHPEDAMVLTNYAGLMTQKGEFQKAEILFKKAIKIQNVPNAYYGLALLYSMAGENDASKSVLETLFARIPQQTLARDHAVIYAEIQNLYGKLSKDRKH